MEIGSEGGVAKKSALAAKIWPADRVERRFVDRLVPYARNARTHSPEQVAQLAASIQEWGWTVPVLVDEQSNIIAGHGRVLAAQNLGISEIPVMVASGWSTEQKRAYLVADNKLALNAGWDEDVLRLELLELRDLGADLSLVGFEPAELDKLFGSAGGRTDPDDVPSAPDNPVSVVGDAWVLGKHRLVCGNCTDAGVVENALAGSKPHLMVSDPPYGVAYEPDWRHRAGLNSSGRVGKVTNDDRPDWRDAWKLFPGDVAYVWHGALHALEVADSLVATGFRIRAQIIWAKTRLVIGRGDYHWQHEPCWYAVRKGAKGHWAGDRKQTTLWTISAEGQDATTIHGTQKPVECMRRPIENNSKPGDAIYEPFSGSGTTIIGAEMTRRCCFAIELDPSYVDVAVMRWQNFTGLEATLEATGEGFAQVTERRIACRENAK